MLVGVTCVGSPCARPSMERLARVGLDGDHADARVLERGLDAGHEPAPADRDDHRVGVGCVLLDLEADRACAGDHERVVEGMHERASRLLLELREPCERVAGVRRFEVDGRAVRARRFDLLLGRALPHHDERVGPGFARREGGGLRVVAGADRDHARGFLFGGEAAHLVQRAARLERAGALEELALEARFECATRERRRACEAAGDGRACALDVISGGKRVSHVAAASHREGSRRRSTR